MATTIVDLREHRDSFRCAHLINRRNNSVLPQKLQLTLIENEEAFLRSMDDFYKGLKIYDKAMQHKVLLLLLTFVDVRHNNFLAEKNLKHNRNGSTKVKMAIQAEIARYVKWENTLEVLEGLVTTGNAWYTRSKDVERLVRYFRIQVQEGRKERAVIVAGFPNNQPTSKYSLLIFRLVEYLKTTLSDGTKKGIYIDLDILLAKVFPIGLRKSSDGPKALVTAYNKGKAKSLQLQYHP